MKLIDLTVVILFLFISLEVWAVFWGRKKLGFWLSQVVAIGGSIATPIIFLLIYILVGSLSSDQIIEENPRVDPQRLSGQYIYQNQTLNIRYETQFTSAEPSYRSQGGYSKVSGPFTESGKWNIKNSNLTLIDSQGVETHIKIVELKSSYQLIILEKLHQDPDDWDWSKAWKKVDP
jgi:hypothetical protein